MKPWLRTVLFIVFVVTVYWNLPVRTFSPPDPNAELPVAISGSIHVHSVHSDGGGTIEEIAAAAKEAGLSFVVITDHNNVNARRLGLEKAYDGVDMFVEMEASTPSGHLLSFHSLTNLRDKTDPAIIDMTWRHFLGENTVPGLFVVIAHPSNIKTPFNRLDRFTDGIEVMNFDSQWQRQLNDSWGSFVLTCLLAPFNPYLSALRFLSVYKKDITTWDTMLSLNPGSFGILAHDAHARLKLDPNIQIRWPDYPMNFKLAANVLFPGEKLSEDFAKRKAQLYRALQQGRSAIHMRAIYPFEGNDWRLRCGKSLYRSGDRINSDGKDCEFEVLGPAQFPYPRIIRLFRNGELATETVTSQQKASIPLGGPGAYRLEVWAKTPLPSRLVLQSEVPYLFYNPLYVR